MSGTLYGQSQTTCVQRVAVVSFFYNIKHKLSIIDLKSGEHKTPAHLARQVSPLQSRFSLIYNHILQPFGKVLAYENDKDVKLFESRAIARYIDRVSGSKLSGGNDPAKYALIETWANTEASVFDIPASSKFDLVQSVFTHLLCFRNYCRSDHKETKRCRRAGPRESCQSKREAYKRYHLASFGREIYSCLCFLVLDVYEKQLATSAFLTGAEVSLADIFHLPAGVLVFNIFPELKSSRPNVKKWFDKLTALPAWRKTIEMK